MIRNQVHSEGVLQNQRSVKLYVKSGFCHVCCSMFFAEEIEGWRDPL